MGMLRARDSRFFMIVDDDDFVSARIVQYVAENPDANGWMITRGYLWDHGGKLLLQHDDFNHVCGTSLIIRSDALRTAREVRAGLARLDQVDAGSHHFVDRILADRGTPLAPLPFRGAVYRVGHAGSYSQTSSLLHRNFLHWRVLKGPRRMFRNLGKLRLVGDATRREFFGGSRCLTA